MRSSMVVLNHNGAQFLPPLLRSVYAQTTPPSEIIVVDNASTDESVALLREHPRIHLVASKVNRGISGGLNQGALLARGEALLFVGCDQLLPPHYVEVLTTTLAHHPQAIVACSVIGMDGAYQWTGGSFHGAKPYARQTPRKAGPTGWASSGAMSIRRRDFFRIGGFSEAIPVAEDVEFSLRARQKGYAIHYTPETWTWHHGGGTLKTFSQRKQLYDMVYSRQWIARRYFSPRKWIPLLFRDMVFAAVRVGRRKMSEGLAIVRGVLQGG